MNIEYHKHWSTNAEREMEYKVYGHAGKPVIVFPSSGGSFYEYEDFKMIEVCAPYIEAGSIQVFSVSSMDKEMWLSTTHSMDHRAWAARAFDKYITDEFMKMLNGLTKDTNTFIISHKSDALIDKFESILKFQKVKNFSKLAI